MTSGSSPKKRVMLSKPTRPPVRPLLRELSTWVFTFEMIYVLFLFSGRFRTAAWLQWLPADISLILFGVTLVLFGAYLLGGHFRLSPAARVFLFASIAFFNYAVLSLLWSPSTVYASEKAADLLVFGLMPLAVSCGVVAANAWRFERFVILVAGFATVMAIATMYNFIAAGGAGFFTVWGGRYPGVGRTVGLGVLVAIAYVIHKQGDERLDRRARLAWLMVALLGALSILVSGARGPLLLLAPAALFLTAASGYRFDRVALRRHGTTLIALLVVTVAFVIWVMVFADQLPGFIYRFDSLFTQGLQDKGVALRLGMYQEALKIWAISPVFGNGLGSYPVMAGVADERLYPHSVVLETGAELGLVGVGLLFLMIVTGLRALRSSDANPSVRSLVMTLLLFTFLIALISGDLSDNRMMFALVGLLPLFSSTHKPQRVKARCVHVTTVHRADDVRIRRRECASLVRVGYDVHLIAPDSGADSLDDGVRVVSIPRRGRLARMILSTLQAYSLASRLEADVYHLHDPELILVGLLLKTRRVPVVFDIHENTAEQIKDKPWIVPLLCPPVSWLYRSLEQHLLRRFGAVVVATPHIAESFPGVRSTVVQNFPVPEWFECGGPYETRDAVIVYHGGISKARGIREMLTALTMLEENLHAELVLAGKFHPAKLERRVRRHRGWRRVRYLGWLNHSDVLTLLCQARVGIVTLHPTGNYIASWPVKLFEYMAAGLPVIASDFPVWRRIVKTAGCGILVDPHDPEQIAHAIRLIIENPDEARVMGRRGRLAVEECYNWGAEETKLLALYDDLLAVSLHESQPCNLASDTC